MLREVTREERWDDAMQRKAWSEVADRGARTPVTSTAMSRWCE